MLWSTHRPGCTYLLRVLGVVRIRVRMNTYEVLYFRGYDHDDWDKLTVTAYTEAEAKSKAQDAVPPAVV